MLSHTTIGSCKPQASENFYRQLAPLLNGKLVLRTERSLFWKFGQGITLAVSSPYDGNAASPSNGLVISIKLDSKSQVDLAQAKAIELGARAGTINKNLPFYQVGFVDLDDHQFCLFCDS